MTIETPVKRSVLIDQDFKRIWMADLTAEAHPELTWFSCTNRDHIHALIGVYRMDFQQPTKGTDAHYVVLAFAAPDYSAMRLIQVDNCGLRPADPAEYLSSEVDYRTEATNCHVEDCVAETPVAWRYRSGGGAIEWTCADHRTGDRWSVWSSNRVPA